MSSILLTDWLMRGVAPTPSSPQNSFASGRIVSSVHRICILLLLATLLALSGCLAIPGEDLPPPLEGTAPPGDEEMRIGLEEALAFSDGPVYLIIGRDVHPDMSAASWTILTADSDPGYRFLFITWRGAVPAPFDGPDPGTPIDPFGFPVPDEPQRIIIYPEGPV